MILVGSAMMWATLIGLYGNSETARVRRRVSDTLATFEAALQAQETLIEKLQMAFRTAATTYLAEIRRGYMQQVSVEEIRKVTPGVRLQPLKDEGVSNLLGCQKWNATRLEQLHGIGPESASRIALAIAALTKSVNSQPVPHPLPQTSGTENLYRPLYLVRQMRLKYFDKTPTFKAMLEGLRPQFSSVLEQTTFFKWLFGSQKKGDLHAALEAGRALVSKAAPAEKEGAALSLANERHTAAKQLVEGNVSSDLWVADNSEAPDYYLESLEQSLGKTIKPHMTATSARVVAPNLQEKNMPVLASEVLRLRSSLAAIPSRLPSSSEPATEPVPMRLAGTAKSGGFRISIRIGDVDLEPIPTKAATRAPECWVPEGQTKSVGNVSLEGGLLYIGKNLPAINGRSVEPALIDLSLPVASSEANCQIRMLDYWSNYTYASPGARASYLQWLATGRNDPEADIGYVFLYFYGLERRALADAKTDASARAEIPAILTEVHRLRSVYAKRASFDRYSAEFLDYLESLGNATNNGQESETPPPLRQYHLSFALKRKLGQFAEQKRPLPSDWAYTWYHNDPRTRLPSVGIRCPEQLAALFHQKYTERFGDGLIVTPGKTRLRMSYRPASSSFGTTLDQSLDLPDVSVMTASYAKLEGVALDCYAQLDAYSRFIGRNKDAKDAFEGAILLPVCLWPEERRQSIEALRVKADSYPTFTLREWLAPWGPQEELSRSIYLGLCRTLAGAGLGLEPDPRFGTNIPNLDEPVTFFPGDTTEEPSLGFGPAALLLRLASTMAAADGEFSETEMGKLRQEIESSRDLSQTERHRLLARMALYRIKPPALTGLKSTISAHSKEERQQLADFLLTMAFADGAIAPSEIKVMEKIYSLFSLDPSALYSRLHELSAGGPAAPASSKQVVTGPLRLDTAKIRQLREASEEVTRRLAVIFNADLPPEEKVPEVEINPTGVDPAAALLDLDEAHAGLLVVLTGRPQWSRQEFEEVCAERDLMPDGAIEQINEAAFAKFDQAMIEGEDPLEIATHLMEEQLYAADNSTKGP